MKNIHDFKRFLESTDEERNKLKVDNFTNATNRSRGQTEMLLNLLDGDWDKLRELEKRIKGHHLHYCPGSKEECEKILAMPEPKSDYLHEWNIKADPKNRWTLIFTTPEGKTHYVAVPPTDGDRIDIIESDYFQRGEKRNKWQYHYDCEEGDFYGIEIRIEDGQIVLPIKTNI